MRRPLHGEMTPLGQLRSAFRQVRTPIDSLTLIREPQKSYDVNMHRLFANRLVTAMLSCFSAILDRVIEDNRSRKTGRSGVACQDDPEESTTSR
jgi:hypothetical protein